MTFLRARQPGQKEERRQALLETARSMLASGTTPAELSLNDIARVSGMAKSNVYRYFETREALLLELLWEEWTAWDAEMRQEVECVSDLTSLLRIVVRSLTSRTMLCELTSILPAVLERNLSEEALTDFKRRTLRFFMDTAVFLHERVPTLSVLGYARLMNDAVTMLVGLYPFTRPSERLANVLENDEFTFFRRDFSMELERYVLALAQVCDPRI